MRRAWYIVVTALSVAIVFAFPHPCLAQQEAPSLPANLAIPLKPVQLRLINSQRQELDLPTCLKLAVGQNLHIAEVRQQVKESQAQRDFARSLFLPSIGVSTGVARLMPNIAKAADVPPVRLTLFLNPARAAYETQVSRELLRATQSHSEAVRQDVLLMVAERYFNLVRAQALVNIAEEAVAQAEHLVKVQQELEDTGVGLPADTLRAKTFLAEQRQHLVEAQKNYRIASVLLATVLNMDPDVTLFPTDPELRPITLVDLGSDLSQLMETAFRLRPEMERERREVDAMERAEKGERIAPLVPSLGIEYWVGNFNRPAGDNRRIWFFIEWHFLDQLSSSHRHRLEAAKARRHQATLKAERVSDEIRAAVIAAYEEVSAAKEQVAIALPTVEEAQETLRVSEERLREGLESTLSTLQVLQAQTALAQARTSLVNAVTLYNISQARLLRAIGGDLVTAFPTPLRARLITPSHRPSARR